MSASPLPILPAIGDPLAAEDPQGTLRRILAAPLDPLLAAEDVVLAWLLKLPDDTDPALAAGRILAAVARGLPTAPQENRLSSLLAEITHWPADRLRRARRRRLSLAQ